MAQSPGSLHELVSSGGAFGSSGDTVGSMGDRTSAITISSMSEMGSKEIRKSFEDVDRRWPGGFDRSHFCLTVVPFSFCMQQTSLS